MARLLLIFVAISGFLTVALGAFGAHGLKGRISDSLLAAYQTGVNYQMFHTAALLALAVLLLQLVEPPRALLAAAAFWLLGMLLFSGSLYWLAVGGPRWLGPVTPLGGLLLLGGWFSLILGAYQLPR